MNTLPMIAAAALVLVAAGAAALLVPSSGSAQDQPEDQPGRVKEYFPDIRTRVVAYKDGETECEGFMAWDANQQGKRPVVLVVHDWMGRGAFDERRSRELASLGYIGFSVDVYGKEMRPAGPEEARKASGSWYVNTAGLRTRLKAGYDAAAALDIADADSMAIMGYCFGGKCALELGRSGASLRGVVTFHGALVTDMPAAEGAFTGRVLVLHGADDPFVPVVDKDGNAADVPNFWKEMQTAKADWQLHAYGHAVHSFTNPAAGNDNSRGAAYNEYADAHSWEAMKSFFWEVFEE